MVWKSIAKIAVLLAGTLSAACTAVVQNPPRRPGPPDRPYCSREYEPVCGRRGNDRESFDNACLAEASGYRVIRAASVGATMKTTVIADATTPRSAPAGASGSRLSRAHARPKPRGGA